MKKIVLPLFVLVILAVNVFAWVPPNSCSDSDGGKVYDVWGFAKKFGIVKYDVCKYGPKTDILKEAYCDASGNPVHEEVSCSAAFDTNHKCFFGRCREFTWCRFEHPLNQNFCHSHCNQDELPDCLDDWLNQPYTCMYIPKDICLKAGGVSYPTKPWCDTQIPEFNAIAAGIALVGAGAGFVLLRRRK